MGEVSTAESCLLRKISSLYNCKMFSDVVFVFEERSHSIKLYGHKLILALRSDYFASVFYENKEVAQEIVLPLKERDLFHCLLRFLYTDDINFQGVSRSFVEDLYAISNKYGVKELALKCLNYLLKERITIDNIFSKYECSLSKNIETLLRECRNFVCHEAKSVFQSVHFNDAPREILEDILKQDNLSLSSEIIAINAVLSWGKKKCSENQLPVDDKNLRKCIYPFLKYMRFLTLSVTEFQSIVEKFNIFTSLESTLLTCKILQPNCDVNIPEHICSLNKERGKLISNTKSSPLFSKPEKFLEHHKFSVSESRIESNLSDAEHSESQNEIRSSSPDLKIKSYSSYIEKNGQTSSTLKGSSSTPQLNQEAPNNFDTKIHEILNSMTVSMKHEKNKLPSSKLEILHDVPNKSKSPQSSSYKSLDLSNPKLHQSQIQYEIRKPSLAGQISPAQSKVPRGQSTPNISFNNFSVSNFSLDTGSRRTFDFVLKEGPQSLQHSFRRDIKCSITFFMKSGNINLYGFELYVKNGTDKSENLEVDVDFKYFSESLTSELHRKHPENNVFSIMFKNPVMLKEKKKGEVNISIDNLFLNRCLVCPSNRTTYELNNGSNCMCDISISSNHYVENQTSIYFLINRLFYKSC